MSHVSWRCPPRRAGDCRPWRPEPEGRHCDTGYRGGRPRCANAARRSDSIEMGGGGREEGSPPSLSPRPFATQLRGRRRRRYPGTSGIKLLVAFVPPSASWIP
ncbi:hypothetical protein GWI33_018980 [Rhynchophorus ferrugineus]|uniref:Uncharacterized protein n=1 Tax=Rhynchophorus ferrugineus TaxID=354439 RepID=A0A834HZ28_RHYFE|nr:hypothetical protein GWI33_018980 [Rhynchophorus ferrugineus]